MNKPPEERAKDVTTVSSAEHTRRDFLYIATGAVGAVGAAAVQRDVDAGAAQLVGGEERRRTEFGEVGQDRYLHRGLEAPVVVERLHRLGEDHVGAGFHVRTRAIDR